MNAKAEKQPTLISQTGSSDSLMKLKASMPGDLMIYFEFNKFEFNPDPQFDSKIAEMKSWLEKYSSSALLVMGYTDLVGKKEFNQELCLKRAEAVRKYLEDKGIPTTRLHLETGGIELSGDYITDEGRAKSRRSQVSIKM